MRKLSLNSIVKAVDGELCGDASLFADGVKRVVTDSRVIRPGDLYIPIKGERFDGHDFIGQAIEKGAVLVMTSEVEQPCEGLFVKVVDTKVALGRLAAYYRSLFQMPVIGITGSVGKTSTKEMLASVLGQAFRVHKTSGNYNNDIGLPLTLLSMSKDTQVAVVELGMNHFGEIDYLSNILKPTIGMIVNIGVSHIEYLGSREGILKAKMEMVPHIPGDGLLVLNGDDSLLASAKKTHGVKVRTYGNGNGHACSMIHHSVTGEGQKMTVSTQKGIYDIRVGYPGEHLLHNAMGCILIAEALGLDKKAIIKGIQAYQPAKMRLNLLTLTGGRKIIDDAYNASVDSMSSALKTLKTLTAEGEESIAVLGSMFEMGDFSEDGHRQVGQYVAKFAPDRLITVGAEAAWISDEAVKCGMLPSQVLHFNDQGSLLESIVGLVGEDSTVLLKASRGMHLEQTRDRLVERFEEMK